MAVLHNILVVVIMVVFATITLGFSICHRYHYSKEMHIYREQHFVVSCCVMLVVCGLAITLFAKSGLSTAVTWYNNILHITQGISRHFPTIWKLLLTLLGLFITFTLLRPNLDVSRIMVYIPKTKRLVANVRNNGLFSVYNVMAKLYYVDQSGSSKVVKPLNLVESNQDKLEWLFAHSDQKDLEWSTNKNDKDIQEALQNVANNLGRIEIRVTADHAISRVRRTIVRQFARNDILVGKYDNGHFKTIIATKPFALRSYFTKQGALTLVHKIFRVIEGMSIMGLGLFFAWYIGGKEPQMANSFLTFDLMVLLIYVLELIRIWTKNPINATYDRQYTFIRYLEPSGNNITEQSKHKRLFLLICEIIKELIR